MSNFTDNFFKLLQERNFAVLYKENVVCFCGQEGGDFTFHERGDILKVSHAWHNIEHEYRISDPKFDPEEIMKILLEYRSTLSEVG